MNVAILRPESCLASSRITVPRIYTSGAQAEATGPIQKGSPAMPAPLSLRIKEQQVARGASDLRAGPGKGLTEQRSLVKIHRRTKPGMARDRQHKQLAIYLLLSPLAALVLPIFSGPPAEAFGPPSYAACTEATTERAREHFCYPYASYAACTRSRTQEIANRCARATILAAPGMIRSGKAEWLLNIIEAKEPSDPLLIAGLLEAKADALFALGDPDSALELYEEAREAFGRAIPPSLAPKIDKARASIKAGGK